METDSQLSALEAINANEVAGLDVMSWFARVPPKCVTLDRSLTSPFQRMFDGPNPFVIEGILPVQVGRAVASVLREASNNLQMLKSRKKWMTNL